MTEPGNEDLLRYMRGHRLAVVATSAADGSPQAALVGVGVSTALDIIFDTVSTSRKHANLVRDPRAAVTFSGPAEQTLQYEGSRSPFHLRGSRTRRTARPTTRPGRMAARGSPGRTSSIGASDRAGFASPISTAARSSSSDDSDP